MCLIDICVFVIVLYAYSYCDVCLQDVKIEELGSVVRSKSAKLQSLESQLEKVEEEYHVAVAKVRYDEI